MEPPSKHLCPSILTHSFPRRFSPKHSLSSFSQVATVNPTASTLHPIFRECPQISRPRSPLISRNGKKQPREQRPHWGRASTPETHSNQALRYSKRNFCFWDCNQQQRVNQLPYLVPTSEERAYDKNEELVNASLVIFLQAVCAKHSDVDSDRNQRGLNHWLNWSKMFYSGRTSQTRRSKSHWP